MSPRSAVDCAEIVQTVVELCVIELIREILVNVKSTPLSYDKVAQLIASLPVTVNKIVDELELPALRAKVTVGAVRSTATVGVGVGVVVVVVDVVVLVVVVVGATVVVVVDATVVVDAAVVDGATVVAGADTAIHLRVFATLAQTSFLPATVTVLPATEHLAPSLVAACTGEVKTPNTLTAITNETIFFPIRSGYRPSRTQQRNHNTH